MCLAVRTENLAKHGLHPRVTHVLVNMPMLYGPLCIPAAVSTWRTLMQVAFPAPLPPLVTTPAPAPHKFRQQQMERIIASVVLCGLFGLSLAPHQEPRFLLPVAMPICMLFGHKLFTDVHHERVVSVRWWFGFNLLVAAFWGMLHQVPSQHAHDLLHSTRIDWHEDIRDSAIYLYMASSARWLTNMYNYSCQKKAASILHTLALSVYRSRSHTHVYPEH